MKHNIRFILPLLTLAVAPCYGQGCKRVHIANESITIENVRVKSMGKKVTLAMTVNLDKLKMGANNQFVLTPTITTDDGEVVMPKMVINGRRQHIMQQRNGRKAKNDEAYVVRRENGKPQQIEYLQSMSYDKRLVNYKVNISEDLCGCGDNIGNKHYELAEYRRPTAMYVQPEVVAEKIQELSKTAYIDFPVNRTELNPQYRVTPTLAADPAGTTKKYYTKATRGTFTEVDKAKVLAAIEADKAEIRKDGKAYYYVPIKHLGKGTDAIAEYGIVRNHFYKITLTGITGFGTPVYDPDKVVDPAVPTYENTFLAARVQVLQWRVVNQNASLGD